MRCLRIVLASVVVGLGLPAGALAHGDGPTHALESVDLYPGYAPPPTSAVQDQLMGYVQAAKRAGAPVKVALAPVGDMLDQPELLEHPQALAVYIAGHITSRVPVIIVAPSGIGVASAKVPQVKLRARAGSDDMAQAAMQTVRRV